jgi:NAD(P)-dependent dehydrogenase (short-subunit alcohol dehydrogenase family)
MTVNNHDEFDLSGRIALVTGGSRGMGKEIVQAFARRGADVIIVSRKLDSCETLAAQVRAETGRRVWAMACHVGDWQQCDALVQRVYAECGRVDVLVNNAGMSPLYPSLEEISEELYDKVAGVNLKGPFRLATLIGSRMARGDGGALIHVSSIAAVMPSVNELPYAMAKAGLHNMSVALSQAFGPKVRSNVIMPGAFMTDITKAWDIPAFEKFARENIPLQRGARPEEIVGAALFLASSASSYVTGAVIKIDGGNCYVPA